jgi:predicted nuclease of predicted toxin-antitoxin system
MKLLADENIPSSIVQALADGGYDIVWIRSEFPGISDREVMRYACHEKRIILTYDKDFGELVMKDNLCPPAGIILLRLSLKNPAGVSEYIVDILKSRTDWEGCFSVIEEKRIRMRPLPHNEKIGE